jgi:hypothetical protein
MPRGAALDAASDPLLALVVWRLRALVLIDEALK